MNRWPKINLRIWETAPFLRLLVPLAAGIICYDKAGNKVSQSVLLAFAAFACIISVAGHLRYSSLRWVFSVCSFVFLMLCGYGIAAINDVTNTTTWYGRYLNDAEACRAVVTGQPLEKDSTRKLTVEVVEIASSTKTIATRGQAFVYLHKDGPLLYHKGDTLLLPAAWTPIKNAGNPYEFDYALYCRRNNILHQQFCNTQQVRLYARPATLPPLLERGHTYATQALARAIPDKQAQGLLQAMLLGDEVNLDPDLRDTFSGTGVVHIIAISGGNVMMFFVLIGGALSWIRHKKYSWISYVAALPLVWLYVVMAGASPSAMRAAVMFSLLAVGFVFNKNNNPLNQLLGTAFVLLCAHPQWLWAIGFQLSFVAVLSLIIFYNPLHKLYVPQSSLRPVLWIKQKLWGVLCASMAAEILVAPLVVYYFHNFPAWFLVANVAAWIFMFFVLTGGIIIVATSWLPGVPVFTGHVLTILVQTLNGVLAWMRLHSPRSFGYLYLSGLNTGLIYALITAITVAVLLHKRQAIIAALCSLAALLASLTFSKWQALQQQQLIVYNMGRSAHVEIITGYKYHIIYTNAIQQKASTVTHPTHIHLQAWQQEYGQAQHIFVYGGKRILLLDSVATTGTFPVDYVIIPSTTAADILTIREIFHPRGIIIAGSCSKQTEKRLTEDAVTAGVALHITGTDGAFVL